jgi:spore coat polysaccharide biosynthesis protein SpsF
MSRTLVVVQARTGSSRLPGKVLLPLAGAPLLVRTVERILATRASIEVVVATTTDPSDDAVASVCEAHNFPVFRGHPTDLLDRHYRAALAGRADIVVKIPSDCPLVAPAVIDRVLAAFGATDGCDYASNLHPATYPDGNDVEVMSASALATAWREAGKPHEREHTTPFLWDQPARFRIVNVAWETGLDWSMSHRFTIDYREDYQFIAAVYDALWTPRRPVFSLDDIVALLARRPDWARVNAKYAGVNWYRHHLGDLQTIGASQTRHPEPTA